MAVEVKEPNHNTRDIWAAALKAAAGVARQADSSEEDLLHAVSSELRRLDMRGTVALLDHDGQLVLQSRALNRTIERQLKKLTGLSVDGFRFDPQEVDAYRRALEDRAPVFETDNSDTIAQMIPEGLRSLLPQIMKVMGSQPVVIAPLLLEDRPVGTINLTTAWADHARDTDTDIIDGAGVVFCLFDGLTQKFYEVLPRRVRRRRHQ